MQHAEAEEMNNIKYHEISINTKKVLDKIEYSFWI